MTFEPTIHPSAVVDTSAFLGKEWLLGRKPMLVQTQY